MNTLNFEEFEMNSQAMKKIMGGGDIVPTGGHAIIEGDDWYWCRSDQGSIKRQAIVSAADCELLPNP